MTGGSAAGEEGGGVRGIGREWYIFFFFQGGGRSYLLWCLGSRPDVSLLQRRWRSWCKKRTEKHGSLCMHDTAHSMALFGHVGNTISCSAPLEGSLTSDTPACGRCGGRAL